MPTRLQSCAERGWTSTPRSCARGCGRISRGGRGRRRPFGATSPLCGGSDIAVVLFYGMYSDRGTSWECGYATRSAKKSSRCICTRGNRTACSTVPSARTCGEWMDCAPTIFPFARPQTITNSAARRICGIAHRSVFPGAAGFFLSRMRGETSAGTRICDK